MVSDEGGTNPVAMIIVNQSRRAVERTSRTLFSSPLRYRGSGKAYFETYKPIQQCLMVIHIYCLFPMRPFLQNLYTDQ